MAEYFNTFRDHIYDVCPPASLEDKKGHLEKVKGFDDKDQSTSKSKPDQVDQIGKLFRDTKRKQNYIKKVINRRPTRLIHPLKKEYKA